jgi:hypothetical protein
MELFSYSLSQSVHYWCIERRLILYTITLLKLFVVSRSFLMEFFGSFRYKIMSSANRDSLTTSFPICIPFISSSYLIALSRNSKAMLNRSGDSGHPCFVPDFRGNGFSFSPFSMMLAIGLSYVPLLCWGTFLLFLVSSQHLSWKYVEFCQRFFYASIEKIMSLLLLIRCITCNAICI